MALVLNTTVRFLYLFIYFSFQFGLKSFVMMDVREKPRIFPSVSTLLGQHWYRAKAAVYLLILLITMPFCLIFTICYWLFERKAQDCQHVEESLRRTVLVSGVAHTKGLHIAKTLGKAGHRVILADTEDFWCSAARWSRFISKFYTVPNLNSRDGNEEYINGMINIAEVEKIDWYIPVSHTKTAVLDTIIKQRLAVANPKIKCLVFDDPKLTAILDDKLLFLEECHKLNLQVPYFHQVNNVKEVCEMAKKGLFSKAHYFLKPLMPYSVDRENFTRIPSNAEEFDKYITSYESKLNSNNPHLVHQFIKGKEFAANAIAVDGHLQAFHVCPCSPMQIDYDVVKHPEIKKWMETFCKAKRLTGCVCFDFLEDEKTGEVYCIECNPRLHSGVVSYHMQPNLERAICGAMDVQFQLSTAIEPPVSSAHVYWLYNEIAKVGLFQQGLGEFVSTLWTGKDAVLDANDPLPFFMLNHLQMPVMLLQALISGKRWNITNYCLGQLR